MRYAERKALGAKLRELADQVEGDGIERFALVFRDDAGIVHVLRDSDTDREYGTPVRELAMRLVPEGQAVTFQPAALPPGDDTHGGN